MFQKPGRDAQRKHVARLGNECIGRSREDWGPKDPTSGRGELEQAPAPSCTGLCVKAACLCKRTAPDKPRDPASFWKPPITPESDPSPGLFLTNRIKGKVLEFTLETRLVGDGKSIVGTVSSSSLL